MSELVDQARLAELEAVVDRGLQTFYEVGSALLEIREQRLYRQSHKTFEWYCRERFGFSDSRGRQLIAAARTVTAVTEQGLPAPRTEREARELARQLRAQADELDGGRDEQLNGRAAELTRPLKNATASFTSLGIIGHLDQSSSSAFAYRPKRPVRGRFVSNGRR